MIIDLEQKGVGGLEARTVTICSGLDFVNINYTPMIARDPDTAKVGLGLEFWLLFQGFSYSLDNGLEISLIVL